MVLVDMNQVTLSSLMMQIGQSKNLEVNPDLVRHMVLNSIRMYRTKFVEDYGELVLCYDSKHYWRKDFFPQYKSNRKKMRESSDFDWDTIFNTLNVLKEELRENFPYKMLEVYGAEADDIIAALCGELEFDNGKTLILSGDKDFIQLHKYKNVTQYSPVTKKYVGGVDPDEYLYEHILKGDVSDGVPNVLSIDNTFTDGLRQKPLGKKKIAEWAGPMCEQFLPNDEVRRNYQRNKKLIDLKESPKELYLECLKAYQEAPEGDRSKLLNYFIEKRLKNLMESIGDF